MARPPTSAPESHRPATRRSWLPAPPAGADAPLVVLLGLAVVAFVAYQALNQGHRADLDYYVPLADAFLHGHLGVAEHPSYLNELVPYNGGWYVVYPPAPAVLLMPLVLLFGPGLDQARVSIALGAIDVALAGAVAYRVVGPRRWIWVLYALLFGLGTTIWYSIQSGNSWQFAHVCATLFLLLAIYVVQRNGPAWLVGLLLAGAALSRLPTLLAAPFFLAWLVYRADRRRRASGTAFGALGDDADDDIRGTSLDLGALVRQGVGFGLGLGIPILGYFAYDMARFGAPLENGYNLIPGLLQEYQYRYGFLSVHSIGRNLYAMLLSVPNQVESFPWIQPRNLGGLSILFTTPAFLWAVKARRPTWFELGAWVSVLAICVPILLHADPGGAQFGYRYAIDYYPLLFLLMIHGMQGRLNLERAVAIGMCFAVNLWGMWAITTGFVA